MKKYKFEHREIKETAEIEANSGSEAWAKFMQTTLYRQCPIAQKYYRGFSLWFCVNGNENDRSR